MLSVLRAWPCTLCTRNHLLSVQTAWPTYFWPIILYFFPKDSPHLLGQLAIDKMLLALAHHLKLKSMTINPFLFFIGWRSASGWGGFIRLQGRFSRTLLHRRSSSSTNSRCTQLMIMYTGFDYESFDSLLLLFTPYFNEFTRTVTVGGSSGSGGRKGARGWFLPSCALVWCWHGQTQGAMFFVAAGLRFVPLLSQLVALFWHADCVNVLRHHP